jgi:hypothetical protein
VKGAVSEIDDLNVPASGPWLSSLITESDTNSRPPQFALSDAIVADTAAMAVQLLSAQPPNPKLVRRTTAVEPLRCAG